MKYERDVVERIYKDNSVFIDNAFTIVLIIVLLLIWLVPPSLLIKAGYYANACVYFVLTPVTLVGTVMYYNARWELEEELKHKLEREANRR